MNQFMNEDLMWERLKEIQREVENARYYAARPRLYLFNRLRSLGHALGLMPRWWARSESPLVEDEADSTRGVA